MIIFLIGGFRKAQFGFNHNFSKCFYSFYFKNKSLSTPRSPGGHQPSVAQDLGCQYGGSVFHSGLAHGTEVSSVLFHPLMLQCGWCYPSWKVSPRSAHVMHDRTEFISGADQGLVGHQNYLRKQAASCSPAGLFICFRVGVFSRIYFVVSLETCIKYTKIGKTPT